MVLKVEILLTQLITH